MLTTLTYLWFLVPPAQQDMGLWQWWLATAPGTAVIVQLCWLSAGQIPDACLGLCADQGAPGLSSLSLCSL